MLDTVVGMLRVGAFALAALVLAPAAAARVHVRVEGKTQTIFGATAPLVDAKTPLDALEKASVAGEFYVHVVQFQNGPYVDQIGRYAAVGQQVWALKVNGKSAAPDAKLRDGDTVVWYWAQNGIAGGPKTLVLERAPAQPNCYRVWAQDDKGVRTPPANAVLRIGKRRVAMQGAGGALAACVGRHDGLVRATAPGYIRSNALA